MTEGPNPKVTAAQLKREAFLYVRQSTLHQVLENTESTQRQYALQQRAVALGWPMEHVHVIDCDLGQSGASAIDRKGFQQLVTEVSLGHAGVVLGLEVSRLARNSADWQHLLELCALSETLILDEDGLYDCNDFNDRLLLGLKGTMSEAELHFLRARLRGGILSKARRGELASPLPVGLLYDDAGHVQLDPDQQVQQAVRLVFETFRRTGAAHATVLYFQQAGLQFPRRLRRGVHKGELFWSALSESRTLQVLHNPRYAGAFFYGRTRTRVWPDGDHHTRFLPSDEWLALLPHTHVGYISWEEYEDNQRRLRESALARQPDRDHTPPREGPALVQGLVICGVCGRRMTVRYHHHLDGIAPDYVCQRELVDHAAPLCQHLPGRAIDEAIAHLLLETLTPISLEVTLAVQQELVARQDETNQLRAKQVERAQYEADVAGQRYRRVDPNNRLVADTLEADWNAALRTLQQTQQTCDRLRQEEALVIDADVRAQVMALTTDFPRVWNDPHTTDLDRKRLARLILEDVTLLKTQKQVALQVRFRGGAVQTITIPAAQSNWEIWHTPPEVVQAIDTLLNEHTDQQVAEILNERGLHPGMGGTFHTTIVARLRRVYDLKTRYERLRAAGKLTLEEMAKVLAVSRPIVKKWHKAGLLQGYAYNAKNEYLYDAPGPEVLSKRQQGRTLTQRRRLSQSEMSSDRSKEVQYEA